MNNLTPFEISTLPAGERCAAAFWEQFWSRSLGSHPLGAGESELVQHFDGLVGADTVLEVGIGDGRNLPPLHRKCRRVVGIDICQTAVQLAALRSVDSTPTELLVGSVYEIPLAEDSCDLVLATDLMNHLSEPQVFCEEIYRVLKPGGRFIGNAMSIRDSSRKAADSKGAKVSDEHFSIAWNGVPNEEPVWLTMRYYGVADLKRLFRGFKWIEPPTEYERVDAGHPPPFDPQPHRHVFWKILLQKP